MRDFDSAFAAPAPRRGLGQRLAPSRNVGSYEAAFRFVAGMLLLAGANHGYLWGWFGLPLIACAVLGFCPVWYVFAINTTARDRVRYRPARGAPCRSMNHLTRPPRHRAESTAVALTNRRGHPM